MRCHWAVTGPPGHRVMWYIVVCLAVSGMFLILAGIVGGFADDDCFNQYNNCRENYPAEECMSQYDKICHIKTWNCLIIVGAVVLAFGTGFVCYFCCCHANNTETDSEIGLEPLTQSGPSQGPPTAYPQRPPATGVPATGFPVLSYAQPGGPYVTYGPPGGTWTGSPLPSPTPAPFHQPELVIATIVAPSPPGHGQPVEPGKPS